MSPFFKLFIVFYWHSQSNGAVSWSWDTLKCTPKHQAVKKTNIKWVRQLGLHLAEKRYLRWVGWYTAFSFEDVCLWCVKAVKWCCHINMSLGDPAPCPLADRTTPPPLNPPLTGTVGLFQDKQARRKAAQFLHVEDWVFESQKRSFPASGFNNQRPSST